MKKLSKILSLILTFIMIITAVGCISGSDSEEKLNEVVFNDLMVVYDGLEHSLSVENLPDGASVVYENNGKVNANSYQVKAIVSLNGKSIEKTATLTIDKATLTVKAKDTVAYVGDEITPEYEITGFVNGETIEVLTSLPTFVNEKNESGIFTDYIVFNGASANNYKFNYESADLKLIPLYSDYMENGVQYIEFGFYPQTVVSDVTLLSELLQVYDENKLDEQGYFSHKGERYFKASASVMTDVDSIIEEKIVFNNGQPIVDGIEYFFKVEPIKWRVMSENNGDYVLMSELLIDTRRYNDSAITEKGENDVEIYASNWEVSEIREFLNGEFINKSFIEKQKAYLFDALTDNSPVTTLYDRYANGKNTFDKVYLPSYSEIKDLDKSILLAKTTDYARAMGAYMLYGDNGYWWTRSPGATGSPPSTGTRPSEHANVSIVAPNAVDGVVIDKYNQVKNDWTCIRPFINFVFFD